MASSLSPLKKRITDDMKSAMRAKEKQRLSTIRLILAAIKQREIDERRELDDSEIVGLLEKMAKQWRKAIEQYRMAHRETLEQEGRYELKIIQAYLPATLGETEIETLIRDAIDSAGATTLKQMGKVMELLKPRLQGRADLAAVSAKVKALLS